MRLDHLLSKENSKDWLYYLEVKDLNRSGESRIWIRLRRIGAPRVDRFFPLRGPLLSTLISGGDALRGHTRSHPEHDG